MGINVRADLASLNPNEYKDKHPIFVEVAEPPTKEDRAGQWRLVVRTLDGTEKQIRFLWERDLAALARAYGGEDDDLPKWVGKKVNLIVEESKKKDNNGNPYCNWKLSPHEEKVSA